ncbi:MAG: UDP-glucuronic acid decarboxylase family protein [candidate division WOR-3 bacterium]
MKTRKLRVAIVAGGAGFIGSHLCEKLLKKQWNVVCVDNLITGRMENILHLQKNPRFRFIKMDISDQLILEPQCLPRADVIFNLASPASPKDYRALPIETLMAGAQGTKNLLEISMRNQAIFVHASTSEVYGNPTKHPQQESYWGNVNPIGERSVYDEAKRFAEALIMAYHRKFNLEVRIARIFNTYGPRMKLDDGRVVPTLIYQALTGKPLTIFGSGRQTRSLCYIRDMIVALYRLIKCRDPYPINLGNPEEFTILQIARLVKKLTKSNSPLIFQPLPPDDPNRRRPDITRAQKLLHWRPVVNLERGLELTIRWFRENELKWNQWKN